MNDAHVHEMQVQLCKPNTRGVTVLLPTPSGTRRFIGAYNIVDALMHVVGSIVFFWYGQCRRLPYCMANVGAHNTVHVLTRLEGCGAPF